MEEDIDAIFDFVKMFTGLKYDDLPSAAVAAAKKEVLDSLATALGGSSKAGIGELAAMVREWGGSKQSTIIAYETRCPAPNAAQVNASMIHALDYDDGHNASLVHTGCITVSTCFAVAERMGQISGREFITALAMGADFMARLGLAAGTKAGWHPTTLYGYLGAAGMAGRIMGLDAARMAHAFGIAYHQCAGNLQATMDGALTKRMGPGLAVRGGITAALMAERGITGARDVLEGKSGLFHLYHGGNYDAKVLTADLGKRFEGVNVGNKPYPCCGQTHTFIDATLSLISRYNIKAGQVAAIKVFGGDGTVSFCAPPEVKCTPRTIVDAQFSIPWVVATALVKGKVTVADFTGEAIQREEVLAISRKVTGYVDPNMNRRGVGPGKVMIITKDGREYTEEIEYASGSPQRPMTFSDCANKFRECSSQSLKPLPRNMLDKIIEMVGQLERLDDATEIIRMVG